MSDVITREITGAKAGQQQPSRPSIADDTIASISRLKMIIGLSEGEVKGLANGAKSIMLEGTPLEDDNSNRNFEGVEWDIRHGTVDQTYIAGMPNASSEIGVGVTVRSDTPWIRSINDTQLSSINVNISFPMLKKVTDKGDVEGVTVDYVIEIQTDGGGYVPVITKSLTAKTSGRYQRTHNVTLPEAQSNWQIRVRKITTDGDNETLFNTMQIDSIAEIIDGKFNYPHTAHLYLSLDARTFSNIPKISVDMLGVYVQVPVNYDTETRISTGIWNGQFKLGYTTNPAWHYYNLITNDRYGLGDKLQPFMIDKWALEHIARICDEPVDNGKGGTEPRFECNLYLQKSEDAYQVLQHIAGIFRGMSFWNGSKIFVDADTPRDCEYVITRANVIGGHFSKSGSAASDRHTIAQVAWSNPDNAYETEYAMVRNERAIAQQGINVLDLSAVGCTSEGQAYRMGLAALLAEQNRTQTASFAMGLDGSLPTVGSRIDIPDMMFTGANNGGRISAVNANRTVITVDRDNVPAAAGDKLIVNLESGKAQTRVITAVNGRAITVALAFYPVAPENVWSVISDELPTMPFIVMSVTSAEDGTQYNYTAMQYDPTMYAQIDNGTIIEQRPPVPSNNPYIIDAPDAVTLGSRHRVAQGITVTTLEITWSQVKDAVAYDVEWRKDDGDWIKLPRTGNISAEIDGIYSGNYLARVRAVSAFDAVSKPATSMLTNIVGKVGAPPKLASLIAKGLLFGMQLDWTFSAGSDDTAYTEIQVASAPDVNVATLGMFAYNTDTHTITGLQGSLSQSYRGRIVDKLGNVSPWSNWSTATTDDSVDKILDLIEGQIRESSLNSALITKIGKIAVNEAAISKETADRIAAILDSNSKINTERDARIADVLDANNKITAEQQARIAGLLAVNEGITTETTQRKAADVAINSRVDTVVSKTDTNTAGIASEITARTNADSALSTRIDTVVAKSGDNTAAISSEITARTNADTALSGRIDTVTAESGSNKTAIQTEITARTTADTALGQRIDTVTTTSGDNKAAIQQEVTARTNADSALSTRIDTVVSQSNSNEATITSEATARTNADSALSTRIDTVSSKADANTATITTVSNTLTNSLVSQAEQINAIKADYQPEYFDKTTYFSSQSQQWTYAKTVARDNYATNERITVLQSTVVDSNATITQSLNTLATKDEALASSIATLNATTGQNTAAIASEATTRTNADNALSQRVDTVQSSTATAQTAAETAQTAANNAATLAGNKGEVIYQWQTPAAARQLPQNLWIDTTGGKNTPKRWDGTAWVVVTDKAATDAQVAANAAQSTATEALGKANTATNNIATIQTELTATTSKTNATASSVTTLQTTVSGNTASIQTAQSSIDGINLQYTVKLDSGGKVSGFGLMNDGATSAFDIRADRFSISAPVGKPNDVNGTSALMVLTNPTEIDGVIIPAGVYMRQFYAAKGSIQDLSVVAAKIGHFKSAESGARLEIKDSLLSVYDANNTLRVRLGLW
ncbi:phage tail fiber host specificity protein [Psychrobacter phage Psymv2]|uniref:tail protein n=1 Tax=Psychrobacter phage Psymv2 TaxID=1071177 RepID=UPI00022A380C|nr:tail protein [Psychrobacter phage Psymv2]AEO01026.1 phage tail fiber host specificity protein [Psychrobacter phage Psymv2]